LSRAYAVNSDSNDRWDNSCSGVDGDRESTDINNWQWLIYCQSWRHHCQWLTNTDRYVFNLHSAV